VTAAYNDGKLGKEERAEAVALMRTLNREAAEALRPFEPNAVTDVTGFGLFGHAHELAERSGVAVRLEAARLPALPGAVEAARAGVRTGGDRRNREFAGPHVTLDGVPEELAALGYDPQTAGGLLVSLPAERVPVLEAELAARGLVVARIGGVGQGSGVHVSASGLA
jgi:selenide,water dikinase